MTLTEEIKSAMKAKDTTKLSTLRMLKAAVQNAEIEKKRPLDDKEFIGVVRKEVKKRQDTISMVGKTDMPEHKEIELLEAFLPQQMTEQEVRDVVEKEIVLLACSGKKDMGRLMKAVTTEIAGRADGKLVSSIVQELLK